MLSENEFTSLRERALAFAHSSFTYLDFEAVEHYAVLTDSSECVLLAGEKPDAGVYELHWGANDPTPVIRAAENAGRETLVTFVPEEWKARFLASGFAEYGILREYWLEPLDKPFTPRIDCEPLTTADAAEAAAASPNPLLSRPRLLLPNPLRHPPRHLRLLLHPRSLLWLRWDLDYQWHLWLLWDLFLLLLPELRLSR